MKNIFAYQDLILPHYVHGDMTVVDATLGNGHDALKLYQCLGVGGQLYGFDIQAEALKASQERLSKVPHLATYQFFQANHGDISHYLPANTELAFAIFNLGYLPGGDKTLITKPQTTLQALDWLLDHLKAQGLIMISSYTGHPGGLDEYEALKNYLKQLPQNKYQVSEVSFINQSHHPPHLFTIERR